MSCSNFAEAEQERRAAAVAALLAREFSPDFAWRDFSVEEQRAIPVRFGEFI